MKIVVLANADQKEELLANGKSDSVEFTWITELVSPASIAGADACIDLLFDCSEKRIQMLKDSRSPLIIINSVIDPLNELTTGFIRINGWNTFLKRNLVEAARANENLKEAADQVFSFMNKKPEWVPDVAGFITPRIVASIINEAYFALDEQVSTRDEIDTAMKLGTNYPFGPFEWSRRIGIKNIFELLARLAGEQTRYQPSAMLAKEAMN
jgi:3-hydroxybutyryl-CoA dehydrogenase